ncbi:hypothetical protein XELAEV_18000493mg [Xenopus laevis]|uniref:Uncharacterized protein n=1 Tax=Xenopus laevis TaxID=8355 RepID=A0A974GZ55_XENLA|nr:hypothetical protein XELAEV_18000493mg [Xenopus laevis]
MCRESVAASGDKYSTIPPHCMWESSYEPRMIPERISQDHGEHWAKMAQAVPSHFNKVHPILTCKDCKLPGQKKKSRGAAQSS